ncbi:MAG TPA: hypothetical protein VN032_04480 [Thermoanaerobaculia bacterium]|jgi:hypothetical protein|nr:hypothetical protein [Thermoanaerobaculia bacterium]
MRKRLAVIPVVLGLLISLAVPAAEGPKPIAVYTAWALNMLGGGGGTNVTIGIYRWSSDAERIALTDVLKTEGNAQMVADLSQLPQVGYIYTQGTLAYALYYAYQTPLPDGGKRIVMATNRPLTFGGAIAPGTRQKYDLGILEMHFSKDGKAEGKIIVQGMASIDKKTGKVEINNYDGQPTRLLQIKEEKQ